MPKSQHHESSLSCDYLNCELFWGLSISVKQSQNQLERRINGQGDGEVREGERERISPLRFSILTNWKSKVHKEKKNVCWQKWLDFHFLSMVKDLWLCLESICWTRFYTPGASCMYDLFSQLEYEERRFPPLTR